MVIGPSAAPARPLHGRGIDHYTQNRTQCKSISYDNIMMNSFFFSFLLFADRELPVVVCTPPSPPLPPQHTTLVVVLSFRPIHKGVRYKTTTSSLFFFPFFFFSLSLLSSSFLFFSFLSLSSCPIQSSTHLTTRLS